jgi:hypothetical protein
MIVAPGMRSVTRAIRAGAIVAALAVLPAAAFAQTAAVRLVASPAQLTVETGKATPLPKITAYDAAGAAIAGFVPQFRGAGRAMQVTDESITLRNAGQFELTAMAAGANNQVVTLVIPVVAKWPPLSRLEIVPAEGRLYTNTTLSNRLRGWHADSSERSGVSGTWRSSNATVATVDRFGNVTGLRAGTATISAEVDGVRATRAFTIATNPIARLEITVKDDQFRTGDVVRLTANARKADGSIVADAPVTWTYTYVPDDSIAPNGLPGGAGIVQFGRFAGNYAGRYTLMATAGGASAQKTIQVAPRDVRQRISVTSRGTINSTHTSDFWPFTGKDGRDYALVGTWGGDGYGIMFDITDMNNIFKTDSVKVDARTINDVTISPDGRYGVLTREGASNRVNGVVILDLANPAHPKIASTFDQELNGGVHNVFATNDHLFAISGGAKYVIIDVKDIYKPKYVSEYRHPNARIHDLWVHDGIAYSAQGGVGTVVVDVGNGKYGGTIEKPKLIATYQVNSGHEIFPYYQKSTGRVYLFLGDEEMSRRGRVWEGTGYTLSGADGKPPKGGIAQTSGGYTHIIDFTDPLKPIPVGRYHLEDYGSHDIIVENDILYQAYYDGGVRVVDVSGELLGNIVDQSREIAVFKPYDPDGYTPNAPFVMNAMPWKGKVLWTDFNSGLWAAKLEPRTKVVP